MTYDHVITGPEFIIYGLPHPTGAIVVDLEGIPREQSADAVPVRDSARQRNLNQPFEPGQVIRIQDLKKLDVFTLNNEFGRKSGTHIYNAVRGIDNEPVKEREARIQYSKITTLKEDSKDYQFLSENIIKLCKEVHDVVLKNNQMFKSIGIHFVQSDLSNKSKSRMLRNPTTSLEELQKNADQLLKEALENQTITIRRLGVKVAELSDVQGQSDITSYF